MIKNTDPKKNMVRIPIEVMELVIKEAITRDIEPSRLIALILENRYQGVNMPVVGLNVPIAETEETSEPVRDEFKPSRQPRNLMLD
ncbi:MAG: hypothetical protein SAK29_37625 [Scytonema sp. PMC 1069.18]|nr:hypothetical protein [Scytonema sp. PMC 1069.18]MEC4884982.1 hypothetical protein [Scytonema sp. PMC 1070.18]